jgi:uncharacterized protein with ParB-like and HNH nuclease domain
MRNFASDPTTIGEFFNQKDTIFRVPLYQREYSWSEENIENMIEDLSSGETYFFGTFVLNNEYYRSSKIKDIVDGQQRILTITIFFSVIRDIFLELKDKQKSVQIQSKYISDKDDDGKDRYKVIASNSAKDFFEKYIQKENNKIEEAELETKEHRKIFDSYQKIKNSVLAVLNDYETNSGKIEKLRKIREDLKNLELIVIEVGSEEDAFTFFETLNSRGTDLTQSDLIKNLIFKNINRENKEIELEWQKIKDSIAADESTEITTFIRHYWLSTRKKITEKKLFKEIKKAAKENLIENYEKLLVELVNEANLYRMIIAPNSSDWNKEDLDVYKSLVRIKCLSVSQSRSILLTLLRMLNDKKFWKLNATSEIKKAFLLIENFTFCFSSISRKSPSALENIYSKFSIELHNEYINANKHTKANIEKILKAFAKRLMDIYPTETEFKDNFVKLEYKQSSKQIAFIKYILQKINYEDNTEQLFDHVTLEHVLPQNPDPEWGLSEEEIELYVNKIGNLIPLGSEYNRDASNYILPKKIEMYSKSEIKMTKDFLLYLKDNNIKWSEREINLRTIDLSQRSWEIWGI